MKTFRSILTSSDLVPNTFLPYLIFNGEGFDFSSITYYLRRFDWGNKNQYYIIENEKGKFSAYPVFAGLMAFPIYLIPLALGKIASFDYYENLMKIMLLGRISAIFYSSLSVVLMYYLLKKISSNEVVRILLTIFFAFGTTMWSISSRGMWQHTIIVPIFLVILILLINSKKSNFIFLLIGLLSGLLIITRPTTIIISLFIGLYLLFFQRRYVSSFILGMFPPLLFMFFYNYSFFGGIFSEGYSSRNDLKWTTPILTGMFGQIFAPGKGIFFISPLLLLSFYSIYKIFRDKNFGNENNILYKFLSLSLIASYLVYSRWYAWEGGDSFGYRFLTDFLPLMVLLIYELIKNAKGKILVPIVVLIFYSSFIQFDAVIYKNSRCDGDVMWTFSCIIPNFLR